MTRLLTDTDRNRAWRQARIQTFESAEPSAAPVLLSIGAQPGAGKTRAVVRTMNTFYPARSFIPIIGDNLRRYHPDYPALVSSPDPDLMPAATAELAGWLVRRSLEHAARHRYCAIVEGTLRSPETTLGTICQFAAAGAITHLVILGVPEVDSWPAPVVAPPIGQSDVFSWSASVLEAARYRAADTDRRSHGIDRVLLHPLWGTLVFFATMFAFFQIIFTVAAPINDAFEGFFVWLGGIAKEHIPIDWLASLVGDGIFAGVGAVVAFIPQIALLFLMIAIMEGSGYLSRAAFLMDRVMGMAGLEGRAFVALLSSVACAIPGIMATWTLPSAKDRIATMMGAPLMTCSARLPVYTLLIAMVVPGDLFWGPFQAQGTVMFGLYLLGSVSAMIAAWVFKRVAGRSGTVMPFYMEMPAYQIPSARSVIIAVWDACKAFLRKVSGIIMATTIVLWALLNFPSPSEDAMTAAGVDVGDEAAVTAYTLDNSYAAAIGRAVSPVFDPLGFDWRINIGVLSSLAAREVVVATLGQVAAAEDPEDPGEALQQMTYTDGPHAGEPVFTAPTVTALLLFFAYALQCASTLGVLRRETGTWRWPVVAFVYMGVVAWVMAFLGSGIARLIT